MCSRVELTVTVGHGLIDADFALIEEREDYKMQEKVIKEVYSRTENVFSTKVVTIKICRL